MKHKIKSTYSYLIISLSFSVVLGLLLGIGIAQVKNIGTIQRISKTETALPTRILDKNKNLITTFFSTENRDIVPFNELPSIILQALITREDQSFFKHQGFSIRGTSRAVWNILRKTFVSGGSTLSQQVAGLLYANRNEFSIKRKLKELWWAFQIERNWSKQEILEEYLNKVYFGHGNYGVETASQFFFGHGAKDLTPAEAVMLVIQLASPVKYSPFKNPSFARSRQKEILDQMVSLKFITKEEAEIDFQTYWNNFDFTREGFSSAFLQRDDKAPYFSEYVRNLLKTELNFSSEEINTGGYTIYTTLDIDMQKNAKQYFDEGLARSNRIYRNNLKNSKGQKNSVIPIAALGMLLFDANNTFFSQSSLQTQEAKKHFLINIQPTIALSNLLFAPSPNTLSAQVVTESKQQSTEIYQEETVEGALISIDNKDGGITVMIGGSKFDATNQFNRATNAFVQPGSSFKPLYYAAGIEAKIITPSTIIWDSPVVFTDEDGNTYAPQNYKGEWKGPVSIRNALSQSMNVPSLKVLDQIGFKKVLSTTGKLLDIPESDWEKVGLVPRYPIGLGIVSVSPLMMAKAYATLANLGKKAHPYAIRSIKDRNGKTIYTASQNTLGEDQVISEQAAYVITSILQTTTQRGTLAYARYQANGFTQPTAGKTGTTQNWSDSWTLGYTPYYTTALWFGFDRGGQSLGTNQTGAITTGPVWAKFMEDINKNLPKAKFKKPNGIVTALINPENNTLATNNSPKKIKEVYIVGTAPTKYDNPSANINKHKNLVQKLEESSWQLKLGTNITAKPNTGFTPTSRNPYNRSSTQGSPNVSTRRPNLRLSLPNNSSLKNTSLINKDEVTQDSVSQQEKIIQNREQTSTQEQPIKNLDPNATQEIESNNQLLQNKPLNTDSTNENPFLD